MISNEFWGKFSIRVGLGKHVHCECAESTENFPRPIAGKNMTCEFDGEQSMNVAHCIECGCDDYDVCIDPETNETCHWIALDREAGVGVCSICSRALNRWESGDRSRVQYSSFEI